MSTEPVGLLFDMTYCGGCYACVAACRERQGVEGDPEDVKELSATARTVVLPKGEFTYRNMCRHCLTPSCASVCPVGALKKQDLGPVTYDYDRCIGCRYCMVACPFNVPRYEWDSPVPRVQKCDMCFDRLQQGEIPACAAACRQEATVFGTREELLALARERIADDPDSYHPHIYGEHEVGGTSVLFLVPEPIPELGFKDILGTEPLPDLTTVVPKRVPGIAICGGAALMAFWWITRRREEVAAAETAAARAAHDLSRARSGKEAHDDDDNL